MQSQTIMMGYTNPPAIEDLLTIAEEIVDSLPDGLERYTGKLRIEVEDFPDDFIVAELDLDNLYDIFGVYQTSGPSALNRTSSVRKQDVLYLYRRPILDAWCETGEDFQALLNRIILQEIGYHFGFSDDEIEMYEEEMLPEPNLILCE
ncbi:MAG: metallopeptidase family protein [Pseudomonadota bacterium]